jgi:hypothetical protein
MHTHHRIDATAAARGLPLSRVLGRGSLAAAATSWLVSALAAMLVLPSPMLIAFSAGGVVSGSLLAQSIPQAAAPTAVVSGRDATVTWPATSLSGGTAASGYIVRRYATNGTPQTVGAACNGTVAATSCVEHNVDDGTWRYSVQAKSGGWTGAESSQGSAVTVGAESLTLAGGTISSLPATINGSIANFASGEGLSFHLDSATGTTLSGTPSTVPGGGSSSVTVTIPAGTTDAPHSVFAVGSTGNQAAAAITINIPPTLVSLAMRDTNGNGKIDQVLAVFSETLATYTAGTSPWTLTNVPSGGSLSGVTVSGSTATLTIAEGPSAATTAIGTFKVALAANSAGIRDVYDHTTTFAATAPADQAAPAILTAQMQDAGTVNGKVDKVALTFSETLATYSAGNTPWTLTNVPSGGTLASVTASGTTGTLTLTEGAGAPDTAVGAFSVALAASATGIRDAAGNQTVATLAPTDGAKPFKTTMEFFDTNVDGRVDQVLATFSEALAPFTAGNGVWTLTNVPSAGTLNSVAVSGAVATLSLTQGAGAATTAVGTFKVALTANAAGIRDAAGNQSSFTAVAPTDKAAPVLVTLSMLDTDGNGLVNRVTALFSETLTGYSAGATPWTLTNVPSGGTLNTVTTSSATATLNITEGAGPADTSVGAMTVALASSATGVHDAALNQGSFAATAPLDAAKPVAVTITDTNGANDGKTELGDSLSIIFSEALAPATVPSTATVTLTDPSGTGNDTLSISGILNGARTTTSNLHITLDNSSAAFDPSPVVLSNGNKTVTITVGGTCTGTGCGSIGQATSATNLSFLGATTLTDLIGNAVTTTAKNFSLRLF